MEYRNAVAEGKTLLTKSESDQWALARLTYRVLVVEKKASIRKWAGDLGVSATHVSYLRNVWAKYGAVHDRDGRTTRTFNEYYVLARSPDDRADHLEEEARKKDRSVSTIDRRPTERDRFEIVREFLRNRRQARRVLRDPLIRPILEREFRDRDDDAGAGPRKPDARGLPDQVVEVLGSFEHRLSEMLDQLISLKLTRADRTAILGAMKPVDNRLGWMRSYVESGDTSFVAALERFLAEAAEDHQPAPRKVRKPRRDGTSAPDGDQVAEAPADPPDMVDEASPRRKPNRKPRPDSAGGQESERERRRRDGTASTRSDRGRPAS